MASFLSFHNLKHATRGNTTYAFYNCHVCLASFYPRPLFLIKAWLEKATTFCLLLIELVNKWTEDSGLRVRVELKGDLIVVKSLECHAFFTDSPLYLIVIAVKARPSAEEASCKKLRLTLQELVCVANDEPIGHSEHHQIGLYWLLILLGTALC